MKRFISLALLAAICFAPSVYAQKDKVVERSSSVKPAWIGHSDPTHFAVTEVAPTLSAAQDKCIASIRQHIVNSVAVNISSVERMATRQVTQNQLMSVMSDYSSVLMTEAGKLPYLSNISLSNAEALYWERIYNKSTKSYRYEYSVRYPFSEETRRYLIDAFMAIDDAKQAELDRLRRDFATIAQIDRIQVALNELDALYDYFFDATRRGEVEALRRNYRSLYNAVSIEVDAQSPGMCVYSLMLDGRRATTAQTPRLKSESVIEMSVKPYGERLYMLSYDPQYASPSDINTVEITYVFGGARVSRTIFFDPSEGVVSAMPKGIMRLEQTGSVLRGTVQMRVKGRGAEVRQLVLWNPADGGRFTASNITPASIGDGDTITFEIEAALARAMQELDIVKGVVSIYNPGDKKTTEVNFTLPYKLTVK